jgi:hypothetical protein
LLQVEVLLSIIKSNAGPYCEVGYVLVTHKKADFFFVPAGDQRILLVSIDRPYEHASVEDRINRFEGNSPAEYEALKLFLVVVDVAAVAEPHVDVPEPCHHHLVAQVSGTLQTSECHVSS